MKILYRIHPDQLILNVITKFIRSFMIIEIPASNFNPFQVGNTGTGLSAKSQVAAIPPIMEVFRKLRRLKVVMTISFWHKQTYKNKIRQN